MTKQRRTNADKLRKMVDGERLGATTALEIMQEWEDVREHAEALAEPLFVSVREAMRMLACSRAHIYRLLGAGSLTARKMGKRTLIESASIRAYGESLPAWTPDS